MPYTKGLQTGQLSPILNAVNPDRFLIINNKSRKVINYFTGSNFKQPLTNYAATNDAGRALVSKLSPSMREISNSDARASDLFDIFCHWLVAVKKYEAIIGASVGKKIKTEDREVIVTVPDDGVETANCSPPWNHAGYIEDNPAAALAHIGAKMGFRIWVPRSDRQNILALIPPDKRGLFLEELPLNYDDLTIKTIEQIDVIWLKIVQWLGHSRLNIQPRSILGYCEWRTC